MNVFTAVLPGNAESQSGPATKMRRFVLRSDKFADQNNPQGFEGQPPKILSRPDWFAYVSFGNWMCVLSFALFQSKGLLRANDVLAHGRARIIRLP